jgi:hypothetical protein
MALGMTKDFSFSGLYFFRMAHGVLATTIGNSWRF